MRRDLDEAQERLHELGVRTELDYERAAGDRSAVVWPRALGRDAFAVIHRPARGVAGR